MASPICSYISSRMATCHPPKSDDNLRWKMAGTGAGGGSARRTLIWEYHNSKEYQSGAAFRVHRRTAAERQKLKGKRLSTSVSILSLSLFLSLQICLKNAVKPTIPDIREHIFQLQTGPDNQSEEMTVNSGMLRMKTDVTTGGRRMQKQGNDIQELDSGMRNDAE